MIDIKRGILDADHVKCLQEQCGISPKIIEQANNGRVDGYDNSSRLSEADLPQEFMDLMKKSENLRTSLPPASRVPLKLALEYCETQARLSGKAREIMAAVLLKREAEARDTVQALVKQLTPKGVDANLAAAGVEAVVTDIRRRVEGAARLEALRAGIGILKRASDASTARPRWLRQAINDMEAEKLKHVA